MTMHLSPKRIAALAYHELLLTWHSLEFFFDILFFPIMNVVLFGLITLSVSSDNPYSTQYLILGILLWEVVTITQYNITVSTLWSVWSHNLSNLFITPISIADYLVAQVLAALVRTIAVVGILAVVAYVAFDFNILQVGWANLGLFTINLLIFAWWLGVGLLGLIFRFGTKVQAISWGVVFIFQPLTASFFPVSVLPGAIQVIAHALPATYVFEAGRKALTTPGIDWKYTGIAFALNLVYCGLALWLFLHLFRRSRVTGQFARNDQ